MSSSKRYLPFFFKVILFCLSAGTIVYLLPKNPKFPYEFKQGQAWVYQDLYSPYAFSVRKSDKILAQDCEDASHINPYYKKSPLVYKVSLENFLNLLKQDWNKCSYSSAAKKSGLLSGIFHDNEDDSLAFIRHLEAGNQLLEKIYSKGVLQLASQHEKVHALVINVVMGNEWEESPVSDFEFKKLTEAYAYLERKVDDYKHIDEKFLLNILSHCIKYNILYDVKKTNYETQKAVEAVSLNKGKIVKGEIIIRKGNEIDDNAMQVLSSFKEKFNESRVTPSRNMWIIIGQSILIAISLLLFFLFLNLFRKNYSEDNKRMVMLLVLILGMAGLTKLGVELATISVMIVPLCLLPIIVRAFFDNRLALFVHIISLFIACFFVVNRFEFVFIQFVAGTAVLFSFSTINKRSQFFGAVGIIFISLSFSYIGLVLMQSGRVEDIDWMNIAWFGGNAMLSLFAYLLIYIFEKIFGFISEFTLIELSDMNGKLLRKLSHHAPGTFQHSLQVANLAEDAIRKIGGNPLLVRVGALYHDIGKMKDAKYFIENQTGINPHDKLSHAESAKIIIGHVEKGVAMAKKYGLPEQIIDFIRTHHGTTRTEYFYRMHVKERPADVDEERFRYPGPKPKSKETAALMMADSCEAASRSLKSYDHESINGLVEGIINYQIEMEQFSNSNITFLDITTIKNMYKKRLMNIYHVRVEYPDK